MFKRFFNRRDLFISQSPCLRPFADGGIILSILTPLILAMFSLSCGFICPNPPNHFVLPDGYSGGFRIEQDEANGADLKLMGGRYVYEVPAGGVLKIKNFQSFMGCHSKTAAYQNGEEIPDGLHVGPDVVALRGGGGSGSREINGSNIGPTMVTYVIGTEDQEVEFFKKRGSTPVYEGNMSRGAEK
jgi:hypothetical protein